MTTISTEAECVDKLGTAWHAYKGVIEEQGREIKQLGGVTAETQAKMARIEKDLDDLHEIKGRFLAAHQRPPSTMHQGTLEAPEVKEHRQAFVGFLRKGIDVGLAELEKKALTIGGDPDGGYLVPTTLSDRMVKRVFDTSPMRQICGAVTVSTEALEGVRDTDDVGAGWTAETGTRSETTSPALGKWRVAVGEMYAEPRATQVFLDDAAVDVESWLVNKVADRFARLENTAFVAGDGVGKPRGFATYPTAATADATRPWGTFEHVKSGANGAFAASNPADVLFDLIAAFKQPYLAGASWVTRRSVLALIRKFKESTTNAYLWQPGLQLGQPQKLLDFPVVIAEDMPALATDSLSLALGNFADAYQIVDRQGVRLLRDPYTAKPYVKFYATKRTGGDAVQFEAVKFVKFSA
jgi:HK97 family phage major capsid protein